MRGDSDVVDIELELWDRVMAVSLRGYVAAMKYALPQMLSRGGGTIVNMSSAAAFHGEPTRPAYATAKAGIGARSPATSRRDGLRTESAATRWHPDSPPPTPSALSPNGRTWMPPHCDACGALESVPPKTSRASSHFLMSKEGEWINGQVINVDGGTVLR
jgi:NAD(P)-dependent dehydrogenase (short-subunit alcohol dehydrogenase family)